MNFYLALISGSYPCYFHLSAITKNMNKSQRISILLIHFYKEKKNTFKIFISNYKQRQVHVLQQTMKPLSSMEIR